jgi:hypothetical protein
VKNHSPLSSAKVKTTWSYSSRISFIFMAWCLRTVAIIFIYLLLSINYIFICDAISLNTLLRNIFAGGNLTMTLLTTDQLN